MLKCLNAEGPEDKKELIRNKLNKEKDHTKDMSWHKTADVKIANKH